MVFGKKKGLQVNGIDIIVGLTGTRVKCAQVCNLGLNPTCRGGFCCLGSLFSIAFLFSRYFIENMLYVFERCKSQLAFFFVSLSLSLSMHTLATVENKKAMYIKFRFNSKMPS